MKYKFERTTYRGRDVFRFVAKIPRQDNLGIPRSYQKTWRAFILDPMFEPKEIKRLFVAEAKRWYLKMMTQIFGDKAPEVMQQEMLNNNEAQETNESDHQHSEDQPEAGGGDAGDTGEGATPAEGHPCPDPCPGHEGGELPPVG